MRLFSGFIVTPFIVGVAVALAGPHPRQADNVAFFSPAQGGGSQLDNAGNGFGEPLNVKKLSFNGKNHFLNITCFSRLSYLGLVHLMYLRMQEC